MNGRESQEQPDVRSDYHPVPFTARLTAYHRALENKRDKPLLKDSFAEMLAGDLSTYDANHRYTTRRGDYPVVRSYYVEESLLRPWCNEVYESQIVLMGVGLDSRAYRFEPLEENTHTVYELDLPAVIHYKEAILRDEKPLCRLVRIPADLSDSDWDSLLLKNGFSTSIPTFWILEGLLYYLPEDAAISLLKKLAEMGHEDSRLFTDVCEPGLAEARFGSFLRHFEWGVVPRDISRFFGQTGWAVSWSYAHEHDQGRDVGRRGLIFVHGERGVVSPESAPAVSSHEAISDIQAFSSRLLMDTLPEIRPIVEAYEEEPAAAFECYLAFLQAHRQSFEVLLQQLGDPAAISHISPRLLRDPLSLESLPDMNEAEREAHVTGYLRGILRLMYWGLKQIDSWELPESLLHPDAAGTSDDQRIESLTPLIQLLEEEAHS
jgi:methyltransferase (TIGR00027 family)